MKVYVDEMPGSCKSCNFGYANNLCEVDYEIDFKEFDKNKKHLNCPLHSITDHDQQVRADERKKVVGEIKKRLAKQRTKMQDNTHCYLQSAVYWESIVAILAQVEKGKVEDVKD